MTLGDKIANISVLSGLLYSLLYWEQLTAISVAGLMILVGIFITFGAALDEVQGDLKDKEAFKDRCVFFIQLLGSTVLLSAFNPFPFLSLLPIVVVLLMMVKILFNFVFVPLSKAHYYNGTNLTHHLSGSEIYQKRQLRWTAIFIALINAIWYVAIFDLPLIDDIAIMIATMMSVIVGMESSFKIALNKSRVKKEDYFRILNKHTFIPTLDSVNDLSLFVLTPLMWLFLDFPLLASYACVFSVFAFYAFSAELAKTRKRHS